MNTWVLYHLNGTAATPGEKLKTFRGEDVTFKGGEPPQTLNSSGRIYIESKNGFEESVYPCVCGLKWILT